MPGCREYERWWVNPDTGEGRCIDKNLTDEWLLRLNRLRILRLKSICEGHLDADNFSQKNTPDISLELTERFENQSERISAEIASMKNTEPEIEFAYGHSEFEPKAFFLNLKCKRKRCSTELEPWVTNWFQRVIELVQSIDSRSG